MTRGLALAAILLLSLGGAFAQTADSSSQEPPPPMPPPRTPAQMISPYDVPAFSRMSVGAGLSPLGIGLQVSTDLNAHFNLRGIGNIFSYSTSITSSGIPVNATLTLGSGGAMVDYYPFHPGFRVSAGLLFVNQNGASATASIPGGNSITLNNQTYFSADANPNTGATPLAGNGSLALNSVKPSAVISTGWGNHVKRSGHWAVPVELGVAFIGQPKVNLALSGWACTDPNQINCTDIAGNSPIAQEFQSNLNAQIAKWNSNLTGLQTYPIISVGVAYSFQTRSF
jgi:hypothetical protein